MMNGATAGSIDEYIAGFPDDVQKLLGQVRAAIRRAAPGATEAIKYSMPTFVLGKNLVHFAAYKNHIGFYPAPTGIKAFAEALSAFKTGKGSVQFPIDEPMPLKLITRIVKYRVQQNLARAVTTRKLSGSRSKI